MNWRSNSRRMFSTSWEIMSVSMFNCAWHTSDGEWINGAMGRRLCAGDNQDARISEWYDMVDRGSGMDIVVAFDAWNPKVMFQLSALSCW